MKLSARNQLSGTVLAIKHGVVTAEVVIDIGNGKQIVSVISDASAKELGLKKGKKVVAIIKSTEVLVGVP